MRGLAIALLFATALASATADSTSLAVSVKDAGSGDPIPDVDVRIASLKTNGAYYVQEARYLFREIPAGSYEVEVYSQSRAFRQIKTVTLRAGVAGSLEFTLPGASSIEGRVVTEDGHPVSGATVLLIDLMGYQDRRRWSLPIHYRCSPGGILHRGFEGSRGHPTDLNR
jgi:hypothetical protein